MFRVDFLCFLTCVFLMFGINSVSAETGQSPVMVKLLEAEQIRKSDTTQFEVKLSGLADELETFTSNERCLYDFLRNYQEGFLGDYDSTINNLLKIGQQCPEPENQIRIKKSLANMQMIKGDFKNAISNLNDAIELIEQVDEGYLKSQVYIVASLSYRLMNQDSLSIKYADLLINLNLSPADKCLGQFNKFRVLMRQGKTAEVADHIEGAIDDCYTNKNPIAALFLQFDWYRYTTTLTDSDQNLAKQVTDQLKMLESKVDETGFKNIRVYYQALLSRMLFYSGEIEQAEQSALGAIESNHSIGDTEQLLMALEVLIGISLRNDDYEKGYLYLKEKTKVENAIYQRKLATQVAYYRVLHENLAQELEIEQLNQNNELLRLENKLAAETTKKQRLMMLLIASILLLLGVWTYKIKKRHDYFKEVAEIDHLTQVFTRKAFEDRMRVMLDNHSAQNLPVNLAIMDLDHFKNVNDQHGHLVGDWVLKQVVLACEDVADEDVLMARLGGEEFCIVSPGITQLEMMRLMERMRMAIEQMDSGESGAVFDITASFGVTSTRHSGYRISMLLTHADLALFEAKNKGRNEVVAFDEIMQDLKAVETG